jgi:hypothetical protein
VFATLWTRQNGQSVCVSPLRYPVASSWLGGSLGTRFGGTVVIRSRPRRAGTITVITLWLYFKNNRYNLEVGWAHEVQVDLSNLPS